MAKSFCETSHSSQDFDKSEDDKKGELSCTWFISYQCACHFHCLQSVCLCCRTISAGSFPPSFATSPWIAPWTTIADPCLNLRTFEHVFTLCPTIHCFCQEHKTIGLIVWRRAVLGCWFALLWISLLCSLCVCRWRLILSPSIQTISLSHMIHDLLIFQWNSNKHMWSLNLATGGRGWTVYRLSSTMHSHTSHTHTPTQAVAKHYIRT